MNVKDWIFRDRRTGVITVAQVPNLPLWIFLVATVLERIASGSHTVMVIAQWTGTVALGWWAVDEIARGVNPWRRLLGVGAAVFVVLRVIRAV